MANSSKLKRIAVGVPVAPRLISLLSQCRILLIPNCNPTPYSLEQCAVAGHHVGPYLVAGIIGGLYVAVLLSLLISLPLIVASMFVQRHRHKAPR
jgi:hypothetical protein